VTPDTHCADCGAPIIDESPSGDPDLRKPCPNCGSTARKFSLELSAHVAVSAMARATVTTYPQALLVAARDLISSGQPSIAVVVAHMACEVAAERTISEAFKARDVRFLEEAVQELLSSCNLANDRTRKLYTALTGDEVSSEQWWPLFKESSKRRNKIIHRGEIIDKEAATSSLDVAAELVKHVESLSYLGGVEHEPN
jgi:hypothetical protein